MGPGVNLVPIVRRNRAPTTDDVKQPNTGKYYNYGTLWVISENPTTGSLGDLWYLAYIQGNMGFWRKFTTS